MEYTSGGEFILGIASSKIDGTNDYEHSSTIKSKSSKTTVEIDISTYAGKSYYVVLCGSDNVSVNLYALWFE